MRRYTAQETKADRDLDRERVLNLINNYEDEKVQHMAHDAGRVCLTLSEANAIASEFGWKLKDIARFWREMASEGRIHHHEPGA